MTKFKPGDIVKGNYSGKEQLFTVLDYDASTDTVLIQLRSDTRVGWRAVPESLTLADQRHQVVRDALRKDLLD